MQQVKTIFLLIFSLFLFSCSSTFVDVAYDGETQSGTLLIDGKTVQDLPADSLKIRIKLKPGLHTFKLNEEEEFSIDIPEEGGILNLGEFQYVMYNQIYETENTKKSDLFDFPTNPNVYINDALNIIDDVVYILKEDSNQTFTDLEIQKAVKRLSRREKFSTVLSGIFIPKIWDVDLLEDFPETIQIKTEKYISRNRQPMSTITFVEFYQLMAIYTPEYFEIRELSEVLNSEFDKEVDAQNTDNQMEME